jgi:hypothetical protein
MKRRSFNLLTAGSAAALSVGIGAPKRAYAGISADQAATLKTTLTPMGAERAANADGSIPAWDGGLTEIPSGWSPGAPMPDFFAGDAKLLSIDASNMAQYSDRLSDGTIALMKKFPNFRIDVYPTHRTAAAPQYVYDNIAKNAVNAVPAAGGARLGFTGAFGGIPFPIPDSDPLVAGAQIMNNHNCRWMGNTTSRNVASYVMNDGQLTLASGTTSILDCPFYDPKGSPETYDGLLRRLRVNFFAPPALNGQALVEWQPADASQPLQVWQYLNGQGRIRKAPELTYDTPSSGADAVANYDEYFVFYGREDRYDWKLIEKKEVYIPYNNNKMVHVSAEEGHLPNFMNPDIVRWELHRVWVVDATLRPGERNVVAHRRYYVDEDTWHATLGDEWDGQGNIWKVDMMFVENRPDIPGTIFSNVVIYNLQANEYVTLDGTWTNTPYQAGMDTRPVPPNTFDPQSMAAESQF